MVVSPKMPLIQPHWQCSTCWRDWYLLSHILDEIDTARKPCKTLIWLIPWIAHTPPAPPPNNSMILSKSNEFSLISIRIHGVVLPLLRLGAYCLLLKNPHQKYQGRIDWGPGPSWPSPSRLMESFSSSSKSSSARPRVTAVKCERPRNLNMCD